MSKLQQSSAEDVLTQTEESTFFIHLGDCLDLLKSLPDNSIDAIVTDPPYGLGKQPDALEMLKSWLNEGSYDPGGGGFMGQKWDSFVPSPIIWKECYRVLKPGGHILAFAGTRTQDLMALSIRIAGFEIRDMIAWAYGSGMPKSMNVSKELDKAAGATREILGPDKWYGRLPSGRNETGSGNNYGVDNRTQDEVRVITKPATEAAEQWEGWGTGIKPALEPLTLARKPLSQTVIKNVLEHGTGALNIDGCRIPVDSGETLTGGAASSTWKATASPGWDRPWNHNPEKVAAKVALTQDKVAKAEELGRWPANLVHDGSPEVEAMFPDTGKSSGGRIGNATGANFPMVGSSAHVAGDPGKGDSGSAARFFYCAKVSKKDRNEGVTLAAMSAADCVQRKEGSAGMANPRAGAGRTSGNSNHHPTVKPTELMRWLVRLITPPGGVVLDPFTGSGSTGKAALWEGFRFIGAEMDERFHQIAVDRVNTGAILGQGGVIPEEELPEDTDQESEDLLEDDPLDWLI